MMCPTLVPYSFLHRIEDNSICVGHVGTLLVGYFGIYEVLN